MRSTSPPHAAMVENTAPRLPGSMTRETSVTSSRRPSGSARSVDEEISTVTARAASTPEASTASASCSTVAPGRSWTSMHRTRWPRMVIWPMSVISVATAAAAANTSAARPGESRPEIVSR